MEMFGNKYIKVIVGDSISVQKLEYFRQFFRFKTQFRARHFTSQKKISSETTLQDLSDSLESNWF